MHDLLHLSDVIANSSILGNVLHVAQTRNMHLIEFGSHRANEINASLLGNGVGLPLLMNMAQQNI